MMKMGYSIHLSERVQELLNEGTLEEILALVKSQIEEEWASTAPLDSHIRESIYHELHALNRVNIMIKTVVDDLIMKREN